MYLQTAMRKCAELCSQTGGCATTVTAKGYFWLFFGLLVMMFCHFHHEIFNMNSCWPIRIVCARALFQKQNRWYGIARKSLYYKQSCCELTDSLKGLATIQINICLTVLNQIFPNDFETSLLRRLQTQTLPMQLHS